MKKAIFLFFALIYLFICNAQNISSSLTACYSLDGNANDPISSLNGTLNSVTSTTNRFNTAGSAYQFNGTAASHIVLPNSPLLKSNAVSFSAWIKVNSFISDDHIVFTKNTSNSAFAAYSLITYNNGGGYRFRVYKENGSTLFAESMTTISLNTWYHVAFTIDNNFIKLYVNGILHMTTTSLFNFQYDPTKNVILGGTNEAYNTPFNGVIDNARFYNRILSQGDVTELYNWDPVCVIPPVSTLTACYDLNGNANEPINNLNGVLSSVTPTVDRFNNPNSAYHFTGAITSYIQLPNSPLLKPTTAFSCNMWLRFDDILSHHFILYTSNGCNSFFEGYAMTLENVGGNYKFAICKSNNVMCSGAGQAVLYGNANISALTWYNVGLYIGTDSMKIYVNGAVDAGVPKNSSPLTYNGNNVYFGSSVATYNYPMRASLDNVKFFHGKLSNQEVNLLYTTDPPCTPIQSTSTLTACYALDGNGNEPINNLTGTLSAVTPTNNRFNVPASAYYFNGTAASYIELPDNPLIKPSNAFSFSLWLKPTFNSVAHILYTKNNQSFNFEGYQLCIPLSGPVFRLNKANSNSNTIAMSTTTITPGTWYHVAGSIDNSNIKLYVNGVLEGSAPTTFNGFDYQVGKKVYIGDTHETFSYPFNGTIDNLRFYNGTLSQAEVTQLYLTDPACTNQPATAINFDGTNDYVSPNVLLNSPANNFTYEMWARPTATHEIDIETNSGLNIDGISNQRYVLWPTHRGVDGGIGISVGTNGVSVYEHGNNFIESILSWTGTLTAWTHLAVVFTNKQPSLYVNGTLVKTGLTSSKPNVWPSLGGGGAFPAQIGGIGGGFYGYYKGDVDEFRLWNHARTPAQISGNRLTEFTCPPTGLIAYYKFNHGIASANNSLITTATDYSGNNYTATLTALALSGSTSNWINPGAPLTTTASILNLSITPSSTLICPGLTTTLIAGGATTYTWLPGNATGSLVTVSPSISTVYTVTGSNGLCVGSETIFISVQPVSLNILTTHTIICIGSSATLTANNATSYTWQPGNLSGNSITVSPSVSTIYSVTGINGFGCIETSTLLLTANSCTLPNPACNSDFYRMSNTSTELYATNSAGTTTFSSVLPPGSAGIAIGPAFGFPAPNPTYWAVSGGTYWYYNGTTFVNTGHSTGNAAALSPGGSKNYIYNITPTGAVYRYNGLGNATFLSTVFVTNNLISDIVGDDLDNFYVQTCCGSGSLTIYDQAGVMKCSYIPIPGIVTGNTSHGGLAIIGNTINMSGQSNQLQTGVVIGNSFSLLTYTNPITGYDFASCMLNTAFSSSISASNGGTMTCANNMITLTANSISGGFDAASSYSWSGPGTISLPNNQATQVNSSGVYTCFIQSCRGGTSVATYTVHYNNTPIPINISSSDLTLCHGETSTLTASGALIYSWTPSASITYSSGPIASVSPTTTTTYSVLGYSGVCSGSAIITISVVPNSSLILNASTPVICEGETVNLSSSTGFSSILWQPGNFTTQNISHIPLATTVYTATALYGSGGGTCSSTNTISVAVNPKPQLIINASANTLCVGQSALLTATGAPSYTWFPGFSANPSISVSPLNTTTYTLGGTSLAGCINYTTFLLQVGQNPTVFVTPIGITGSWTICEGKGLLIDAQGATNYTFSPSSSINTTTLFPNAYVANPSVTTTYTLSGEAGGCSDDFSFTVTVNPAPLISISNNNTHLCSGQSVALIGNGGSNYIWEPGTLYGPSILVSPTVNTSYTVTASSNLGCNGNAIANVTVGETPSLTPNSTLLNVCSGTSATLNVSGATTYTWLPGNQTGDNIIISPLSSEIYTVIGANGICLSVEHYSINVIDCNVPHIFGLTNAASNPVPYNSNYYRINFTVIAKNVSLETLNNVILNSDLKNTFPFPCSYTVISAPRIMPLNGNLASNSLFDGDSQLSLTAPITSSMLAGAQDTVVYGVLVEPKGFYGPVKNSVVGFATLPNSIVVRDSSNNGFAWDPDKDGDPTNNNEMTIIDLKKIELFIPEGFSPNDDGKNDLFVIRGLNNRRAKISIFNRWGNKVFVSEGTQISWDGKANVGGLSPGSDKLPAATYFYVLEFQDSDEAPISGFVVLQY